MILVDIWTRSIDELLQVAVVPFQHRRIFRDGLRDVVTCAHTVQLGDHLLAPSNFLGQRRRETVDLRTYISAVCMGVKLWDHHVCLSSSTGLSSSLSGSPLTARF